MAVVGLLLVVAATYLFVRPVGRGKIPGSTSDTKEAESTDKPANKTGGATPETEKPDPESVPYTDTVRLQNVLDGDSLLLSSGEELRLIGVDAPEKDRPYADRARNLLRKWLSGDEEIGVAYGGEKRDRYDRILAYVYDLEEDGKPKDSPRFVNDELIRRGYARAFLHRDNPEKHDELVAAQKEAIQNGRGLFQHIPSGDEKRYLRFTKRYRFHRPDCSVFDEMDIDREDLAHPENHDWITSYETRRAALLDGLSPCRECNP